MVLRWLQHDAPPKSRKAAVLTIALMLTGLGIIIGGMASTFHGDAAPLAATSGAIAWIAACWALVAYRVHRWIRQ
jgi:hypothetical protein